MKNFVLAIGAFLVFVFLSTAQSNSENSDGLYARVFKQKDLQEDFKYLRRALEETHPGLYRYNTKEQMDKKMDSTYSAIKGTMSFYDYYSQLALLIAQIRCAHTPILPKEDLCTMPQKEIKIFPYQIEFTKNKAWFTMIRTTRDEIKPGFELISINGVSIDSIKQIIFKHLWSDGYIESYKPRMIHNLMFSFFYHVFIASPDSFDIRYRNGQGLIAQTKTAALSLPEAMKNTFKNPLNKEILAIYRPKDKLDKKKGWRMEMKKEPQAAVLIIRSFTGGNNGREADKKMRDFMNDCMKKIQKNNVRNLIVDLRWNNGGWDSQGEELFTYCIHTPTRYYARFHTVTDSSEFLKFSSLPAEELKNIKNELIKESDGTFTIKEEYNYTLAIQKPKPNRFTGKVYFLINGGSVSTTAEFTAAAHSNRLGTFIGEETGGNYEGGNGGEFINLVLPNTKIKVTIPLLYYHNAVNKPSQPGRGTIPDYYVPNNIEDILKGIDTQLNFVYDLIKKENGGNQVCKNIK